MVIVPNYCSTTGQILVNIDHFKHTKTSEKQNGNTKVIALLNVHSHGYTVFIMIVFLVRFKGCPVIAVAAKPGGPDAPDTEEAHGIAELVEVRPLQLF